MTEEHTCGLGTALIVLTPMVEIVLELTWQFQSSKKKYSTVWWDGRAMKRSEYLFWRSLPYSGNSQEETTSHFFLCLKIQWEFKRRSGKVVYRENTNFCFKTNLFSLDNLFLWLKDINGQNKKMLVEPTVYSQQLNNLTNKFQNTAKWSEFKAS